MSRFIGGLDGFFLFIATTEHVNLKPNKHTVSAGVEKLTSSLLLSTQNLTVSAQHKSFLSFFKL